MERKKDVNVRNNNKYVHIFINYLFLLKVCQNDLIYKGFFKYLSMFKFIEWIDLILSKVI